MPPRELKPELRRFVGEELPAVYQQQVRDFVRIFWFEVYLYTLEPKQEQDEVAFVMVEEDALYSHSSVCFRTISCNGIEYASGGLSAVLTYTWFRKRGYGSEVVAASNEEIDRSSMDIALLWTDIDTVPFYAALGWEHLPTANTVAGERENPHHHEGEVMLRFVSKRAKSARSDFETMPIYIGNHGW